MTRRPLACAVLAVLASACADLTAPSGALRAEGDGAAQEPAQNPAAVDTGALRPQPQPQPAPQAGERIRASHILIAYQGATRSQATRTKDDAKKLAEQLLGRVRAGQDFGALAREHSNDPSAKARAGDLGSFDRTGMVKPFADAAFALKPGEVSGVVETEFGFHIIKRAAE